MLNLLWLTRPLTWALRTAAWALLLLGLLLGMAWAILHFWIVPRIEDLRPRLEVLASQTVGVPVQMGRLVAVSSGWMPTFEIHDLRLLDPEGRTALTLPKVIFAISVRSVLNLGVEQLVIDSPTLSIERTAQGQWRVAGLVLKKPDSQDSDAADWLFSQKEVVVQKGRIAWSDEWESAQQPKPVLQLSDVNWVLRNSARHHQWRLDATPPTGWGDRFVLMGDLRRALLSTHAGRMREWSGQVHAHFPDVDLAQLGPHLPMTGSFSKGQGALRLWVDIKRGELSRATADVVLQDVLAKLGPALEPLSFKSIAGRLSARQQNTGFDFSTEGLGFETADGLHWPGGNLHLQYAEATATSPAQGHFQGDKLDLQALRSIALRLPLPSGLLERLKKQSVQGLVEQLSVQWQGQGDAAIILQASGKGQHLSFDGSLPDSAGAAFPGLEEAALSFDMTPAGGNLTLAIERGAVRLGGVFEEPRIGVDSLQASMSWKTQNEVLSVPQWQLSMRNPDLTGQWHGSWRPSPLAGSLGVLDLQGTMAKGDATRVHRYLPLSLPQSVRHYVRDSVQKGSLSQFSVKLKGDLHRLPFANPKEGEFLIAGKVQDAQYAYVPARPQNSAEPMWPALQALSGNLVFDRLAMRMSNASAKWGGVPFTQIKAEIANLAQNPVVVVSGESKASASSVLSEVQRSPVSPMLGDALAQSSSSGLLTTRLGLTLPILALDNSKVQGNITLANNDVRFQAGTPMLEKAQGVVNFTEAGFSLSGVTAQLFGGPLRIEGGTRRLPPRSSEAWVQLRAQGQVTALGLRQAKEIQGLPVLAEHASGSAAYSAVLGFKNGHSELLVNSNLQGLALSLPAPLNKSAEESVALRFESAPPSAAVGKPATPLRDQIQLDWGRHISAFYLRDISAAQPRVIQGHWRVGEALPAPSTIPETGVSASLSLTGLSLDDWLQAIDPPKTSAAPALSVLHSAWQDYLPTRVNLHARELTLQNRALHNVVVDGSRDGLVWRANMAANEFSGYLEYRQPSNNNAGRVYARLARLSLPPSADQTVATFLQEPPLAIPALDIVVDELELRGKKMGRVEIEAVNSDNSTLRNAPSREWTLNKLNVTVPEASLKANGRWLTSREGAHLASTEMNFKLDVSDAGELFNRLGTKDALRAGGGKLEGKVSWNGAPLTLHYPSMTGHFNVNMGRGQFLQADPGVAKLLGVLSLQALPRRLLLDFRDVFSAGFSFDTVRGDVTIEKGMASTRNLQMKGVNAVVQMEGSSDLARETQNLRVVILPEVDAGTASLVAGLALNPAIGLSTFLAQLFLRQPLIRANSQEFVIDGTWREPRVTKAGATPAAP